MTTSPELPDILADGFAADPYSAYGVLRENAPLFWHEGTQSYVISRYEDVPPPAPKTVARPTTLGACQVRLHESRWLVPSTWRANFCARKFISFVLFEHEKMPIPFSP